MIDRDWKSLSPKGKRRAVIVELIEGTILSAVMIGALYVCALFVGLVEKYA